MTHSDWKKKREQKLESEEIENDEKNGASNSVCSQS